jgi:hypothetical protein
VKSVSLTRQTSERIFGLALKRKVTRKREIVVILIPFTDKNGNGVMKFVSRANQADRMPVSLWKKRGSNFDPGEQQAEMPFGNDSRLV